MAGEFATPDSGAGTISKTTVELLVHPSTLVILYVKLYDPIVNPVISTSLPVKAPVELSSVQVPPGSSSC